MLDSSLNVQTMCRETGWAARALCFLGCRIENAESELRRLLADHKRMYEAQDQQQEQEQQQQHAALQRAEEARQHQRRYTIAKHAFDLHACTATCSGHVEHCIITHLLLGVDQRRCHSGLPSIARTNAPNGAPQPPSACACLLGCYRVQA